MKILLIGGNGFLGSHIADRLTGAGMSVRSVDVAPERFRPPLDKVEYVEGSFLTDDTLNLALENVDVVCHLASTTVPSTAAADPARDVRENLLGSLSLLKAMRSRGIRRLIFVSSGGTVYGAPDILPIPETHALRPRTSYGIVKAAIETYICEMQRAGLLDPLIFRLSNPYGPRQDFQGLQGVIASFLRKISLGEPVEIWGDGSVVRDYVFATDVAEVFARAVVSSQNGVFNVGSGNGISLRDLLDTISSVVGHTLDVHYGEARSIDVPVNYLDVSKVGRAFDWQAQTTLASGLALTWNWIQTLTLDR